MLPVSTLQNSLQFLIHYSGQSCYLFIFLHSIIFFAATADLLTVSVICHYLLASDLPDFLVHLYSNHNIPALKNQSLVALGNFGISVMSLVSGVVLNEHRQSQSIVNIYYF